MKRSILLLLLLCACNPLRPQQLPQPEMPEIIEQEHPRVQLLPPQERWWTNFNDQQLNQLQQQLFAQSLDLDLALSRFKQSLAAQRITAAARWPSLSANGSYTRSASLSSSGTSHSGTSRLYLSAAYELDLWNKLNDRDKAAQLRTQASEQELQTLILSLSAQLGDAYFRAVEQAHQLELLNQQIAHYQNLETTITERYRSGLSDAGALYQVRADLTSLYSRRPQYLTGLRQAENQIALLIGQKPSAIAVAQHTLPPLNSIAATALPADLLTRRPDISAALLNLDAADHELAAALADRLPGINLSATLGRSFLHLSSGNFEGTVWSLAAALTQPLVDGGRRKAETERQRAIREEQYISSRQIILQALEEVDSALNADLNHADRSLLLAEQIRLDRDNLVLTRDNYLSGLEDSDTLLRREITHINLLSQQVSHHYEWLSNRIALTRALGGNWMAAELDQQRSIRKQQEEDRHD